MQTLRGSPALIAPADGLAYVRGATDIPLSELTVGEFLRETARRLPDQEAVGFREQGVRWRGSEFDGHVDRLAAGLLSRGIEKRDRAARWVRNRSESRPTRYAT